MRVRKISAVGLVVAAAGLSLTACTGNGTNSASGPTSSATTAGAAQGGGSGSSGSTTATPQDGSSSGGTGSASGGTDGSSGGATGGSSDQGQGAGGSTTCRTANLSFSSSHGMGEGEFLINLTNTGHTTCTMHGFPGVDLKGKDGTISAARSKLPATTVTLRPGQETRFTLHYPPNTSGGSGVTFGTLVVTPPNETHSHVMSLTINLAAGDGSGPSVYVDPVGAGK